MKRIKVIITKNSIEFGTRSWHNGMIGMVFEVYDNRLGDGYYEVADDYDRFKRMNGANCSIRLIEKDVAEIVTQCKMQ